MLTYSYGEWESLLINILLPESGAAKMLDIATHWLPIESKDNTLNSDLLEVAMCNF